MYINYMHAADDRIDDDVTTIRKRIYKRTMCGGYTFQLKYNNNI